MISWFKKQKTAVKVLNTKVGSHGDHWKAIYGSDNSAFQEIVTREIEQADSIATLRKGITRIQRAHGRLSMSGLLEHGIMRTFYPVLLTPRALPVTISEIVEWRHIQNMEAQIIGKGRGTFALNFFATDYLEQAQHYQAGGIIMVALTGIAYQIQEVTTLPPIYADQFCCYLPFDGRHECMDYNFVGQILSIDDIHIGDETCHILNVRLINGDEDTESFNLELFVNTRHVTTSLQIDTRISGTFWLQGHIATPDSNTSQSTAKQEQPYQKPAQRRW